MLLGGSAVATAVGGRVAYLDNARYWVMLLVVVGHSLNEFVDFPAARSAYTWIYLFHMPFFVLISGYTARNWMPDARRIQRMVSTLVVPYLIVETSLQLLTRIYDGEPTHLKLLSPQWVGWFLAALVVWRFTTPVWRHLRYPVATAIAISLMTPLIEVPNVLALPKVLGFLPFYVIGMRLNSRAFDRLAALPARLAAVTLLAGSAIACRFVPLDWPTSWLLWKHRYDEVPLDAGPLEGIVMRAALIAIGLVLTFAVLALVSRRESRLSRLGGRTLYCYLLHGFFIIVIDRQYDVFQQIDRYGDAAVLGTVAVAVLLAHWLMSAPIATIFRPVFEPRLNWLFHSR